MALVDVSHIHKRCEKDSVVVLVDSANRDKTAYATPSEYSADLQEPVKLVYGVSILDAMIPNTMYTVDEHNKLLSISFLVTPNVPLAQVEAAFAAIMRAPTTAQCIHALLEAPVATSAGLLVCTDVDAPPLPAGAPFSTVLPPLAPAGGTTLAFRLRSGGAEQAAALGPGLMLAGSADTYVEQVAVPTTAVTLATLAAPGTVMLSFTTMELPVGNYFYSSNSSSTAAMALPTIITQQVAAAAGQQITVATSDITRKYTLQCASLPFIIHTTSPRTIAPMLGLDTVLRTSTTYSVVKLGPRCAGVAALYDPGVGRYTLTPSGVVNLTSVPYIILRCKEIEDSIHRSNGLGKQGLGVFKLAGGVNDVTHLRFDFATFLRKPFHPIRRLTRLTFRFERPDGQLYDFKGVNHMFVLSINYYAPETTMGSFDRFQLNPSYNPDYAEYSVRQMMTHARAAEDPPLSPQDFAARLRELAADGSSSSEEEEDAGPQRAPRAVDFFA